MPTTNATAFSDLTADIVNQLPGVSSAAVATWVKRSARQFCIESGIWEELLLPLSVAAYQSDYVLTHTYDASINQVEWITVEDSQRAYNPTYYTFMPVTPQNDFIRFLGNYVPVTNSSVSAYDPTIAYSVGAYASHSSEFYRCVVAIPTGGEAWTANHWVVAAEKGLRAYVMFIPSFNAATIPGWIIDRYGNTIIDGARVASQHNWGPWQMPSFPTRTRRGSVNPMMESAGMAWREGVNAAKYARLSGFNGASLRASTPVVMDPASGPNAIGYVYGLNYSPTNP